MGLGLGKIGRGCGAAGLVEKFSYGVIGAKFRLARSPAAG